MELPEPPEGWGDDSISHFLDVTRHYSYATYFSMTEEFQFLVRIYDTCVRGLKAIEFPDNSIPVSLYTKAVGTYLGATRLVVGGQVPEAIALMRICLETGLYAFHIQQDESLAEVWLNRNEGEAEKNAAKKHFRSIKPMLTAYKKVEPEWGDIVEDVYENTIDMGGHPNPGTVLPYQDDEDRDGVQHLVLNVLAHEPFVRREGVLFVGQAAFVTLQVFRTVFKEQFDKHGISKGLDEIRIEMTRLYNATPRPDLTDED